MPRTPSVFNLKADALSRLDRTESRYISAVKAGQHYLLLRWMAAMSAVEVYATWEGYAEWRLVVALNHHPQSFIKGNDIHGITRIPVGLAKVLVRGNNRYFDFRSTGDLRDKARKLVDRNQSPFEGLTGPVEDHLDTLGAIRNYIVHQSDSAYHSYCRHLSRVYGLRFRPKPQEFLNAIDYRKASPARNQARLIGLIAIVRDAINLT